MSPEGAPIPVRPVDGGGRHPRRTGFRDGLAVAAILFGLALASGRLAMRDVASQPGPPTSSRGPSGPAATTPAAAPTGPCADARRGGAPTVLLAIDQGPGTSGAILGGSLATVPATPSETPELEVESGSVLDIRIPDGPCPIGWHVDFDGRRVAGGAGPAGDGTLGSAVDIGFPLASPVRQAGQLRAHLAFGSGDLSVAWSVVVSPPSIPFLTLVDLPRTGAATATDMIDGCGFMFDMGPARGGRIFRSCPGSEGPTGPLGSLFADPGATLSVENSEFTPSLNAALPPVACGHLTGDPAAFADDRRCLLAFAASPNHEFSFRLPDVRGDWVIAVRGCFAALTTVCGSWYAAVDTVGPPRPT